MDAGRTRAVDVDALHRALEERPAPLLVDVRTGFEFSGGHVPGAVNIPLPQVTGRVPQLADGREVWLICASGARSEAAARALGQLGVRTANVTGGTQAWSAKGYPLQGGSTARRLMLPVLGCATLGLAPYVPEPHVVGKLRWVAGGAAGMNAMDWFDLLLHGAPWIWLAVTVVGLVRRR